MERLNYFVPYQSKKPWHEDQLTRAFLVVLRFVPMAQAGFVDLVREGQVREGSEHPLPSFSELPRLSSVETQVSGRIDRAEGRLVSLVLTDERWTSPTPVERSDRGARYDGLLTFGTDWTLVIENKPSSRLIRPEQLSPSLPEDSEVELDPVAVPLSWREIVARLSSLLDRDQIDGASRMMVEDFLRFVDEHFGYLNPYTSFRVCREDLGLLTRRCKVLLDKAVPGYMFYHHGHGDCVRLPSGPTRDIWLGPKEVTGGGWNIELAMFPGDTVAQAREFYGQVDGSQFLGLRDAGWSLEPNLHFAFAAKNLVWATPKMSIEDYLEHWRSRRGQIRREPRDSSNFERLFDEMIHDGMISTEDVHELKSKFTDTKRGFINICPGWGISFRWTREEAIKLDDDDGFADGVKEKAGRAMRTWRQTLPAGAGNA